MFSISKEQALFIPISKKYSYPYLILTPNPLHEEICTAFNGKAHRRFASNPTCCNSNCPRCGGNGCAKYTDTNGNELGAQQCCGQRILKRGKFCESEGETAPCKVQFTENDVLDHLNNIVIPPEKYF